MKYVFMKYLLFTCYFLLPFYCYPQSAVFSKDWKSYPIPTNPDTLRAYNRDKHDWTVFVTADQVYAIDNYKKADASLRFTIKPNKLEEYKFWGDRSVLPVEDGFLVGFDNGEWGGYLYWFSKDGKEKYEIASEQIAQFITRNDTIFAIEGHGHLVETEGKIMYVYKDGKKWTIKNYLTLPSSPWATALDEENNFIIVTFSGLLQVDNHKNITPLIKSGFWTRYLYPYSLAIYNDTAYIGMRKGIFKYHLTTRQQEWLMKN